MAQWKVRLVVLLGVYALVSWGTPAEAARDLTLAQALALAGQQSPHLKAAYHETVAAQAQHDIAAAASLPRIEASETFVNSNIPSRVFGTLLDQGRFTQADFSVSKLNHPSPLENYKFGLTLTQPVYNGGRERLGVALAEVGREAAEESLAAMRQRVLFSVTQAYQDLVLAKTLVVVAREAVQLAQATVKQVESRYAGGLIVKSEVMEARVRLASFQEEAVRAERRRQVAAVALQHTIGLHEEVDATEPLPSDFPGVASQPAVETEVASALERRPDYRVLDREVRRAEIGSRLASSAFYPNVNIVGSYDVNNTAPISSNGSSGYTALAVVSLNLFNGLSDSANIRKARAQEEKVREQAAAKRREIEVEVIDALAGVRSAGERIAVTDAGLAQSMEGLRISRNRYGAGLSPLLDLLAAEQALNQAKQARLLAGYEWQISQARLALATGRLGD
jgi:outer membrane protein TolC